MTAAIQVAQDTPERIMTSTTFTTPDRSTTRRDCSPAARVTRSLLGYGVIAGPCYVVVSIAQGLAHEGFDLTRHDWSLLAAGPQGWIQMANLVITGLIVIACAVGVARCLDSWWAPRLLALYGAGLAAAGVLVADPWAGYPVGAPETTQLSWHGIGHMAAAWVGFVGLIAATVVVARHLAAAGRRRAAWASRTVGACFVVGICGVATGSSAQVVTLGFTAAVVAVWAWLAALAVHLYRQVGMQAMDGRV